MKVLFQLKIQKVKHACVSLHYVNGKKSDDVQLYLISLFKKQCETRFSFYIIFYCPPPFRRKWKYTVFGFPWGVVVARGAWRVVRGSEFLVGTLSP